ncbi:hypothetical protein BJ138DRAFT_1118222 [Hygrophoropsis aurantiaca]|uniref:Uncharacterized protein n=1 Tax=Hygrophoropsis aurantiaca TaxID=72124 RepID=A0ACB7ZX40_9AGAM|nr:hypothetical protein BJ138DRAFT_1118222 [Hygrophoropsis aurantiaca]
MVPRAHPRVAFSNRHPSFVRQGSDGPDPLIVFNAKCIMLIGDWVISSPNMDYITYYSFEQQELQLRADGRLGAEDVFQTPQCGDKKYLWYTAMEKDFVVEDGLGVDMIGRLNPQIIKKLRNLVQHIQDKVDRWFSSHSQSSQVVLRSLLSSIQNVCDRIRLQVLRFRDIVLLVARV